ncbi:MAG: DUF3179 domain-containing (seleno)protein [Actinomycetota bacterium]
MARSRPLARLAAVVAALLVGGACASGSDSDSADSIVDDGPPRGVVIDYGVAPEVPDDPLAPDVAEAVEQLFGERFEVGLTSADREAFSVLALSGDARLAWIISDLMRVAQDPVLLRNAPPSAGANRLTVQDLSFAASELTGFSFSPTPSLWNQLTNALLAWDLPAPPGYLAAKRNIYTAVEPAWEPLLADGSAIDWRLVSWGGVLIDDRPFGSTDDACNCIPAADNPPVQTADDASWLADDAVVFGVVINGEARAYPRRIMEVREMVNDTLGGRDIALPYCTLCGSAQVWFTDDLPDGVERPVFRTSGLLSRSNKVMYDLNTQSIFDTFLGTADSGPLHELGISLTGHPIVTSTWGAWVEEHPDTTVLVERLALGRDFDFRNGRDAAGPIFPIGQVDPRLAIQEDVLGIVRQDGRPLAVHVDTAAASLERGEDVVIDGISIVLAGDGLQALDEAGEELTTHQAFWFAWSQFHPLTEIWPPR